MAARRRRPARALPRSGHDSLSQENAMIDPLRTPGTAPPAQPSPAEPPPVGLDVERPDGPPVSGEARKELEKRRRDGSADGHTDG